MLTNCLITGNSAGYYGGGASGGRLYNCRLSNNSARFGGGHFANGFGSAMYNCTLTGNSAAYGGGVLVAEGMPCTLYNCTIAGNSAEEQAGGVMNGRGCLTMHNCVVHFNTALEWPNYSGGLFEYSSTTRLPPGPGNTDADPRFVNAAAGDYRLRPDSPCIDAGTNLTELLTTDFLGVARPLDGNGDGLARFDMGAYEYHPAHGYAIFTRTESTAQGLVLEWNEAGEGMKLQRATGLARPDWQDLLGSEKTNRVTLPVWGGNEFFRLIQP